MRLPPFCGDRAQRVFLHGESTVEPLSPAMQLYWAQLLTELSAALMGSCCSIRTPSQPGRLSDTWELLRTLLSFRSRPACGPPPRPRQMSLSQVWELLYCLLDVFVPNLTLKRSKQSRVEQGRDKRPTESQGQRSRASQGEEGQQPQAWQA